MRVELVNIIEAFVLHDVPRLALTPVTVILNQVGDDRAQLIVECSSEAWSTWFMLNGFSARQMVSLCTPGQLASRLHNPNSHRTTAADRAHETRIAEAVIALFKKLERVA